MPEENRTRLPLEAFQTYQDAVDFTYVEYEDINSNKADSFFAMSGFLKLIKDAFDNTTDVTVIAGTTTTIGEICQLLVRTLNKSAGGSIRVDPNTTAGVFNLRCTDLLIEHGILSTEVAEMFIAQGVKVTTPYADATQEDYDAAVAFESLNTPLSARAVNYDAGLDYIVKSSRNIAVRVVFDEPVSHQATVTVTKLVLDDVTGTYIPEARQDKLTIGVGQQGKSYAITQLTGRKYKFELECNLNLPFQATITQA